MMRISVLLCLLWSLVEVHSQIVAPVMSVGSSTATSISLSWTSAGSEAVSYEVMWETDDIGGCSGGSHMNSTTITDGSTSYDIMGLEEDSSYTISVTASNSAGSSAVSNTVTAMTLEAAPSASPVSVSASEVTFSSITVQWRPVDCIHRNGVIIGYTVRYKVLVSGSTQNVFISGGSITGTTISNLTPSTTYNVRVAAVTDAGTGVFSNIYVTQTQVVAPVISVGVSTATSISLSWTSAGSEVDSYEVMWETDDIGGCSGGSDLDSTTITDGSTSYDIMGLKEDSSYTISVTASNSAGSSAVSNTVTAMTLEAAPTAPPTSVSVSEVTPSSITVQWGPVDCIHRNGDIAGYSVQYREVGSAEGEKTQQMVSIRQAIISGLTPSTEYAVSVATVNNVDTGGYSDEVIQQTTEALLVSLDTTSTTSVTISWALADGLTATTDYTISYSNTDTECFTTSYNDITISQTMTTLTGLEEGTDYSITVTVSLSDGGTGEVNITVTTMTAAPSAPPTSVSVSEVTSSSIIVQWGPVDCVHRNGDIIGYSVQYGSETVFVSGNSSRGMHAISGLVPFTTYSIQVAAETSAGTGVYSDPLIAITDDVLAVLFVSSLTTTDSLTISWALADGLTATTDHIISYLNTDCPSDTYNEITDIHPSEMMYTLTGLEEGTDYSIMVTASLSYGVVEDNVTATTTTAAPSAPPTSVSVSKVTFSSITVQWGPVDCIHRNGDITGYSVQYREVGSGIVQTMSVSVVSGDSIVEAIISNLDPSTIYTIEVAAANSARTGVYSYPVIAETPQSSDPEMGSSSDMPAIIGGAAATVIALIVGVVIMYIVRVKTHQKHAIKKLEDDHVTGESPLYSDIGGAIPTSSNMAYELTTLPGPDDGRHEYEVVGRGKTNAATLGTEAVYEIPDITPHPPPAVYTTSLFHAHP